jgi:porin
MHSIPTVTKVQRRRVLVVKLRRKLVAAVLIAFCAVARAGAPPPFSPELFLDWEDLRELLRQEGIDFRVSYVSETATNLQGGDQQLWRYTDQWTFWTTLDLDKLFGVPQAKFDVVVTDRNGHNLSTDADLDSLQQVQELYGRGQTWRWTEFSYDQSYLSGKLDWKIGRMPEGNDFDSFSCEFMNLTFCGSPPGNIAGSYWYNWPVSQFATRVKATFQGFGYVELGAYAINPSLLLTRNGMNLGNPPGTTGVLAPFEIGWLPSFHGLAGSYKIGAWYSSASAPDVVENTAYEPLAIAGGEPLVRHGQYGAYLSFQQQLTAPAGVGSKRGLSVFVNATYADRRTSLLDSQIAIGMLYTGPFASRPGDELGFAVGETHVNPRVAQVERLEDALGYGTDGLGSGPDASAYEPAPVQTAEWAGEIFYDVHLRGWLDLRPNFQYVAQPGGVARNTSDVIFGLRVSINI